MKPLPIRGQAPACAGTGSRIAGMTEEWSFPGRYYIIACFKGSYPEQEPDVPGSRICKRLNPPHIGVERYSGSVKENRCRAEESNTYV